MRYNKLKRHVRKKVLDVCYDVEVEPSLQLQEGERLYKESTGTDCNARLDMKANGFWGPDSAEISST